MSDEFSKGWKLQQLINEAMVPVAIRKMANNMLSIACAKVFGPHQVRRCEVLSGKAYHHTCGNLM